MDTLINQLRFALRHLYDSEALRASPLVTKLGLAASPNPGFELRQTLIRLIRSMRPESDIPAHAEVWRAYQVLLYRYVQRCSQLEVADQLGISVRQLRREEHKAYRALADWLMQSFNLEPDDGERPSSPQSAPSTEREEGSANSDLAWLDHHPPTEPASLRQVLLSAADLIRPLAKKHGVRLAIAPGQEAIPLALHPVVLRQILLSLLSVAIRQAREGSVEVSTYQKGGEAVVQIGVRCPDLNASAGDESDPSLMIARRLIDRCKGRLTVYAEGNERVMSLAFPILEWLPVLVIDDNAGFRLLLQRYAAHTRYQVLGAANLQEAMDLISQVPPRVIILDVMMPETDGWELLGRLRQHPATSHIPIVVCTILAEEDLAYSLGAKGFMRKPVTRQMFLSALDDQVGQVEPRPH